MDPKKLEKFSCIGCGAKAKTLTIDIHLGHVLVCPKCRLMYKWYLEKVVNGGGSGIIYRYGETMGRFGNGSKLYKVPTGVLFTPTAKELKGRRAGRV